MRTQRRYNLIGKRKTRPYCERGKYNPWNRWEHRQPEWDNTPERMHWKNLVRKGEYDLL